MPNKPQQTHPLMARLPAALGARMDALGHTQKDVEAATGVHQSQVSRALSGDRKRLTAAMVRLCRYAAIDERGAKKEEQDLQVLLAKLTSLGPAAEECVRGVLRSLEPLLVNSSQRTTRKS